MKNLQVNGMNIILWLAACLIIIIAIFLGAVPDNIIGALAICFSIGSIALFVGDRIPIWKTYFGGGVLLTLFVGSSAKYFGWLPESAINTLSNFIGPQGFLDLFIIILLVGSIMDVDRKMLLSAVSRFVPCVLAALAGGAILGLAVGMLIGKAPAEIITFYVLPILSGGSGAGAIPLGQMYTSITGNDFNEYISISMAVLGLGDILAIVVATIMGKVLSKNEKLCGNGKLMKNKENEIDAEAETYKPTMGDLANCLVIIFSIYMFSMIISRHILPTIAGAPIHPFAYAVIIAIILKMTNVIPENITSALIHTQEYVVAAFIVVIMFCCGAAYTDLGTVISSVTDPATILLCLAVVCGAALGAGLFGQLVGLYPYEASVTAGLCAANAGGAGDIAILSSCKLMNLLPYSQISNRIGNALILIIGSFAFAALF